MGLMGNLSNAVFRQWGYHSNNNNNNNVVENNLTLIMTAMLKAAKNVNYN